ncbi:hypothetical protein BsWGS_09023 [Bradybaena similaris]
MPSATTGDIKAALPGEPAVGSAGDDTGFRQERLNRTLLGRVARSLKRRCIYAITVLIALGLTVYVLSKLVVGSMYVDACPLESFIPLYLIVSATLFIIFVIVIAIVIVCQLDENDDRVSPVHLIAFLYFFIHLVLQLTGSVCIVRTRHIINNSPFDDSLSGLADCDSNLMTYSVGAAIFELGLSGLFVCFAVFSLCEVVCNENCLRGRHL